MNRVKLLLIFVVTAAGMAVSFLPLKETYQWMAARYWRHQLVMASDDRVEIVIREVAQCDQAGIPILVESMGSDRECVARAAKQELLRQVDKWRRHSVKEQDIRFLALAEALAQEVDHFDCGARKEAADLAVRILIGPHDRNGVDSIKLLAASEKVLRTEMGTRVKSVGAKEAEAILMARLKTNNSLNSPLLPLSPLRESSAKPIMSPMPVAEERLSSEPTPEPKAKADEGLKTADSLAKRPSQLDRSAALRALERQDEPGQVSRIADHVETPAGLDQKGKGEKHAGVEDGVRSISHVGAEAADRGSIARLAAVDAFDLMRALHHDNEAKASEAEKELIRRGLNAMQLDLARRLFDPDPAVRKELVERLPGLQNVDAVSWLLHLSRDADAGVRLAAITLLATSTDPGVLDQLEQIVQRDTESSIRKLAERIAQQRKSLR